jgi:hypothetical protein
MFTLVRMPAKPPSVAKPGTQTPPARHEVQQNHLYLKNFFAGILEIHPT